MTITGTELRMVEGLLVVFNVAESVECKTGAGQISSGIPSAAFMRQRRILSCTRAEQIVFHSPMRQLA
jgi:hypothetical protein